MTESPSLTHPSSSPRIYVGYAREENLLERLRDLLSHVDTHGFQVQSLEPHNKDGGVFIKFTYKTAGSESTLQEILGSLRESIHSRGGVPSWVGLPSGDVWLVQGTPWREVRLDIPNLLFHANISFRT